MIIMTSSSSKSSVFIFFPSIRKSKAVVFKFFRFEERFQKLQFCDGLVLINGMPYSSFSSFSGVLWEGTEGNLLKKVKTWSSHKAGIPLWSVASVVIIWPDIFSSCARRGGGLMPDTGLRITASKFQSLPRLLVLFLIDTVSSPSLSLPRCINGYRGI